MVLKIIITIIAISAIIFALICAAVVTFMHFATKPANELISPELLSKNGWTVSDTGMAYIYLPSPDDKVVDKVRLAWNRGELAYNYCTLPVKVYRIEHLLRIMEDMGLNTDNFKR